MALPLPAVGHAGAVLESVPNGQTTLRSASARVSVETFLADDGVELVLTRRRRAPGGRS